MQCKWWHRLHSHVWCHYSSESSVKISVLDIGGEGEHREGGMEGETERWRLPVVAAGSGEVLKVRVPGLDLPCWFSATTNTSYSVSHSRPVSIMYSLTLGRRISGFQSGSSLCVPKSSHETVTKLQKQKKKENIKYNLFIYFEHSQLCIWPNNGWLATLHRLVWSILLWEHCLWSEEFPRV